MFHRPTRLERTQLIKAPIDTVWAYFSSPQNLKKITPDYMGFVVHTPAEELKDMYPGQLISYTVKPVLGIPLQWTTEITHVEEEKFFVDEQIIGPYTLWHHQHHFKEVEGGVEMKDIVNYALPLGPLGWCARKLLVERQLNEIFDYRYKAAEEAFGSTHTESQYA